MTTYRDAGFMPEAFINFLCLLGWSPKNDREVMSRQELIETFSFEGIHRSNAVVNFKDEDPFDPKAAWLNAEYIRTMPAAELAERLLPGDRSGGIQRCRPKSSRKITAAAAGAHQAAAATCSPSPISSSSRELAALRHCRIDSAKRRCRHGAARARNAAAQRSAPTAFTHDDLEAALRNAAAELGIKTGQMFQPIRVAVCGRKNAPPLFGTLEALGREVSVERIDLAMEKLKSL